jgi:hypothetical protein
VDLVAKRGSSVYIAIAPFVDRSALQSQSSSGHRRAHREHVDMPDFATLTAANHATLMACMRYDLVVSVSHPGVLHHGP